MSFIAALIDGVARHLSTEPSANPVPAVAVPAQSLRRSSATAPLESPMHTYLSIFRHSPLPAAATPAAADEILSIYQHEAVQRAAAECAGKLARLCETAGFVSEIHAAVEYTGRDGSTPTSAAVIEALRQRSEAIDEALEDWKEDRARHDEAIRACAKRHEPLRKAVSQCLDRLVAERDHLVQADESERRANRMGLTGYSRFTELRKAGLTEGQIAEVLPGAASPETVAARRNERCAELVRQIGKIRAFNESPTFDAALLDGLGFDELISARDGMKAPA